MSGHITPAKKVSRRGMILGVSGIGILAFTSYVLKEFWAKSPQIQVLSHDSSSKAHLIRTSFLQKTYTTSEKVKIAIIGAGISGLSAGYFLKKSNFEDFRIYEMNSSAGGNSDYFSSVDGKASWGAHYLPIIRNDDQILKDFLTENNIIVGEKDGLPIYREEFLCQDPHERLLIRGHWQDSLIPDFGLDLQAKNEIKEFHEYTNSLKKKKGRDGRPIFAIPLDESSRDPNYLQLDQINFKDFLLQKRWVSPALHWYANYACQDDFGTSSERTSAWAGLHYFCSRNGRAANAEDQAVITWPEGNGFLNECLQKNIKNKIQLNSSVHSIKKSKTGYLIQIQDLSTESYKQVLAEQVIYCLPRSTAPYILPEYPKHDFLHYYPWLIAHIVVDRNVLEKNHALAWDTVKFLENDLGYINNHHQYLVQDRETILITFYFSFTKENAKKSRSMISNWSPKRVQEFLIESLNRYHPGIQNSIRKIDYKLLGHGMISPSIDFLWNKRLHDLPQEWNGILFAHTDMSGISLFEEAFHQGHRVIQKIKNRL